METKASHREDLSSAHAVLMGALAPGGPTWNTLKIAFFMLGVSLVAMLGLAFSSSDSTLTLHVAVFVFLTGTLFFLLSRSIGTSIEVVWMHLNVPKLVMFLARAHRGLLAHVGNRKN